MLVMRNSQLVGDAPSRLVDVLFRVPSLTSIAFTRDYSSTTLVSKLNNEEEEEFAAMIGDLPPSITSLIFDQCLSPAG